MNTPQSVIVQPELDPNAAATVAKLRAVLEQIRQLEADAETYKAQLRDALRSGAYTINGQPALSITPNRRFNAEHAEQVLPPQWLDAVRRSAVDSKLAKELLPPALFATCQVESGKPTVRLA